MFRSAQHDNRCFCLSACKIDIPRLVIRNESRSKSFKGSALDLLAGLLHQVEIKMQVVQRNQAQPENFFRLDEMPDVAARELASTPGRRSLLQSGPYRG